MACGNLAERRNDTKYNKDGQDRRANDWRDVNGSNISIVVSFERAEDREANESKSKKAEKDRDSDHLFSYLWLG
jgi:hypothetical protein